MRFKYLLLVVVVALAGRAAPTPAPVTPPPADTALATDPGYRLSLGDRIIVNVFGEPELATQQMIDREGRVRLPLIGAVVLGGLTVREAEARIEATYRKEELLKSPQVALALSGYAPREITLLGAVRSPGTFQFPADTQSLDIRDVISRQGGFTAVAKSDAVAVTRRQPDGRETTTVLNVERMMSGRSRSGDEVFLIYPGDRIFVPERLF